MTRSVLHLIGDDLAMGWAEFVDERFERSYWCDTCRDEHEEGEYRCRRCGATVEPEWVFVGPDVHTFPGLRDVTLRLDDGRVFRLRHEEAEIDVWPPSEEWLARVTSREPDEWQLFAGKVG